MRLTELAIAALMRLVRPSHGLDEFADQTARAVQLNQPVLVGATQQQELALVLAVAFAESGFRRDVVNCTTRGDRHISPVGSVSAYQLLGPWARQGYSTSAICSDHMLATSLAMNVLRAKHAKCRGTIRNILSAYNTGSCTAETPMVRQSCMALDKMRLGLRCSDRFGVQVGSLVQLQSGRPQVARSHGQSAEGVRPKKVPGAVSAIGRSKLGRN